MSAKIRLPGGPVADPFKDRLDAVIAETGARLLEYRPPAAEWKEGRIY